MSIIGALRGNIGRAGLGRRRGTGGGAATIPAAMTSGQWGVVNAWDGQATINILSLPTNGGSAITDLEYKIGSGSWSSLGATTTGSYTRSGFTDFQSTQVLVRAVNAIGAGTDSDTKSVTTLPPALVSTLTDQALAYPTAMSALDFGAVLGSGPYSLVGQYDQIISGLSLNPITGVISGTPNDRRGRGWHEIRVKNSAGQAAAARFCSAPDMNPSNFTHVYSGTSIASNTTLQNLVGDVLILNPNMDAMLVLRNLTGGIVVVAGADVDSLSEDGLRLSNGGNVVNCTVWGGNWVAGKNALIAAAGAGVTHPGLRLLNMRIVDTGAVGGPENFHGIYCQAQGALVEGCVIGADEEFPSAPGMRHGSGITMRSSGIVRGCFVRTCENDGIGYFAGDPAGGGTLLVEQNNVDDVNIGGTDRDSINLLGVLAEAPLVNFITGATIRNNIIGVGNSVQVSADYAANGIPVLQLNNIEGGAPLSNPAPFTLAMWNATRAGPGQARIDIFSLPANGGDPIDGIEYRLGLGVWTPLSGFAIGSYAIGGVTNGAAIDIQIRPRCLARAGAASDTKTAPATTVAVSVPNQVAPWGAKTLSGGGLFRPINSLGQPVELLAPAPTDPISGSKGVYTAIITNTTGVTGGLGFTGAAGAPAGSVWRCNLVGGGSVDITIDTLEANTYHVQTLQQASTAYGQAVLGDKIRFRAGDKNTTPTSAIAISRGNSPAGTWTGGSDLTAGNWVTLTRDAAHPVRIGAVEIGGFNGYARYLRVDDLEFWSPLTANENGGIPSVASAQLSLYSNFSSTATMAVTNCRFSHQSAVTGTTIAYSGVNTGPLVAIACTGGPFWIEGNVINGCHTGINANSYNSTGAPPIIRRNSIRRAQIDVMLIGQCTGLLLEGNLVTDKLWPHTPYTVTGVTPGNPTVFTVASTAQAFTGDIVVLTGFTGAFAALNGRAEILSAKTATTLTMNVNTTGLTWDGLAGIVRCPTQNHGDYIQFSENNGAAANQINVQIRGNVISRGQADGHWMPDGQGFFAGMGGTTSDRTGWLIEGNLLECTLQRGISIGKLINSTVRSNTIVRPLGLDGGSGGSSPAIIIEGGANNIYRDNLANGYSLGSSAAEDVGNATITITNSEAIPAHGPNVTAYGGYFMAPPSAPDTVYDAWEAYATKTSGGTPPGPIYPGATPYFNRATLTYANPR